MLIHLKRLVPSPLKDLIKEYLQAFIFEKQPEIIALPDAEAKIFREFMRQQGYLSEGIDLRLSKNDTMYQNSLKSKVNPTEAHLSYLLTGLQVAQVLQTILLHKFGDLSQVEAFLDFAGGYGRVTRFLLEFLAPEQIYVSEIKAKAVACQQQQFGVHGFLSSENPEDLQVDRKFDCIFALSLFTHLPEATFARWLQRLCELLTNEGILLFTVKDITQFPGNGDASDFIFQNNNEELRLRTADIPLDANQYGTTYVSESFIAQLIEKLPLANKNYSRYEKAIGSQYLYIITNNSQERLSGLDLVSSVEIKAQYREFRSRGAVPAPLK